MFDGGMGGGAAHFRHLAFQARRHIRLETKGRILLIV